MSERIFDPLRKKEVPATPEELVRQGVIRWLNEQVGIPLPMMVSECSFTYNRRLYRADILVRARDLSPIMLVECKAPDVKINEKVIEQGIRYNRVLKLKYLMFTNGKTSYFCERVGDGVEYRFLNEIPEIVL
ncbi:MAG: type I restriction enzyme HsdR N-terminal domain-containing protein [Bacteroidales bacterium]|nr:type I restriction enzyme HsdR N-terminal domain-containing protein [Bacteroidales bacterium]